MRDFGALLWIALVVVGVVSSIVSNARKQAVRSRAAPQPRQQSAWPPGRPQPQPHAAPVAAPPKPRFVRRPTAPAAPPGLEVFAAHEDPRPKQPRLARLFGNRRSLVRAVVAAEVLGKPRALRDE